VLAVAASQTVAIQKLAAVSLQAGVTPTAGAVRSTADFSLSIDVPAGQMDAHRKRLEKDRDQLTKNIASSKRQLGDDVFLGKAPAQVVDSIRTKLADYEVQLAKVLRSLEG
jgi:valyl-tRNA synthetase